ncbi:MAG: hypothetical protein AAGD35_03965 [Actinomycetota bacterium]
METLTMPSPAAHRTATFDRELSRVRAMLDGQVLVSQDRCVDALLDLFNLAPGPLVRELLGEMLSDIRFVSAVRAELLRDDLSILRRYC